MEGVPPSELRFSIVPRPWSRRVDRVGERDEGTVSELLSALDELAVTGLGELSDDGLLDLVAGLVTATNRMAAAFTSAVRTADRREAYRRDGAVSMKAWLRGSCPRRRRPSPPGRSVRPTPASSPGP